MEGGPNIQEVENSRSSSSDEEQLNSGCSYSCCNPRGQMHRFIALTFMCFLGFGSYFCYDNPAALEDHFEHDLNITKTQYTGLYSIYSWPNVALCFVGGFLIDRVFGIRLGTSLYMGLTLIGQVIFAGGVLFNSYLIMLLGRFIFGIGAESLAVAQNNYAVLWFKGKELNMVFGLQLSFARIGSTVNFAVMESVYEWITGQYKGPQGLGIVLFVATTTCLLSMLCALVLGFMDKRAERILQRPATGSGEVVELKDIIHFKSTFWLITVICVSYYVAIFPFVALGKVFFTSKFHMTNHQANYIDGLVYLVAGVTSPVLGFFIDKMGKNISWIALAVCVTIGSHSLLAFTSLDPHVGVVLMGMSYSCLASSLWPLVSMIIPEYQLGTAYGVCQAIQNLGLAVFAIITGIIADKAGYTWLEFFFICCLVVALCATLVLWIIDRRQGGRLNMTPGSRIAYQRFIDEEEAKVEADANTSGEGLQPSSDFQIRNRYLSRIGAPVSDSIEE